MKPPRCCSRCNRPFEVPCADYGRVEPNGNLHKITLVWECQCGHKTTYGPCPMGFGRPNPQLNLLEKPKGPDLTKPFRMFFGPRKRNEAT